MKIQDKESENLATLGKRFEDFFERKEDLVSMFMTLLGGADNISQYLLEREQGNYLKLPAQCKYGLLQIYQLMTLSSKIIRKELTKDQFKIGGYFPSGKNAWKSEKDFEKRFILMVKLFYKHLKEEGKIKEET